MNKILILVNKDHDWSALYINGAKVYENHSITISDLFEHVKNIVTKEFSFDIKTSEEFPTMYIQIDEDDYDKT